MTNAEFKKLKESNNKKGNNSIYDLSHHGDEVIVSTNSDGRVIIAVKTQTGIQEHRSTLLSFESQTQCERLLPSMMKALK